MKTVYPDYYNSFRCIADKCRHNCCVGWEIDIDPETLELYKSTTGDFGKRLWDNISLDCTPHFILSENERCPFLNSKNLCDIYSHLGEKNLCQICTDHPRFYNELSTHTETGLGLCCEEAARLIITQKEPFTLKNLPEEALENPVLFLRSEAFEILQNREKEFYSRVAALGQHIRKHCVKSDILSVLRNHINYYIPLFESLEKLSPDWEKCLSNLKDQVSPETSLDFEHLISEKDIESQFEQFLCYLIYRHMAKAEFEEDAILYIGFAILSLRLVMGMSLDIFAKKGDFTCDDLLELVRLFSCEIEYSDENIDKILDFLEEEFFSS